MKNRFKGYYFRHQNNSQTVAFIPGESEDGAFIQVITDKLSRRYDFPRAEFGKEIKIGASRFGKDGITLRLPDITGSIKYRDTTPISSDIMGIFRFFPMECRHTVVSMRHSLSGSVMIDGEEYNFSQGIGYIEGDSGRSFPKKYLWLHANDFPDGSSIMLSVADIPFYGLSFDGVICVLMYCGREYRLATYYGAKAEIKGSNIIIRQGKYRLTVNVLSNGDGHRLSSPQNGRMSGIIKEHNNACIHIEFSKSGKMICELFSSRAGFEVFPK